MNEILESLNIKNVLVISDYKIIEEEKRRLIKTKCCKKQFERIPFLSNIESINMQNIIAMTCIFSYILANPNPWICPLCNKGFNKINLKELYSQYEGLNLIKKYCCSCGNLIAENPISNSCGHNLCSYCSSASLPCNLCLRI